MEKTELIQIDIRQALADKLGSKMKFVPGFVVNWLKRTICQDEINAKLREYYPRTGADFCRHAIEDYEVDVQVLNAERLPSYDDRRVIFVSNHPLGGFDGLVLIAELCARYGDGLRFIVNDLLMQVGPLSSVFLPINKHGEQSRESIIAINEAMEGPDPIVIFPAGLVSRLGNNGKIEDLEWHKMFVTKALQYHRDVVPLFFDGQNSPFFYKLARWRKRLGVKFNVEMIYLPSEMLGCRGKHFTIKVGQRVPWQQLSAMGAPLQTAQKIKEMTYSMNQ